MKNNFILALSLFAIYALTSCNELVEKDLKDDWVYAIAPQDFAVINTQTPVFGWEKVKGAISYNLKLYSTAKDYNTVTGFIVDTNVTGTQYTQTLKSGYYKWYIYAQNGSSQSGLSIFRFQVDSSSDITNQHVILVSPKDNAITDTLKQVLVWSPLANATQYNVQVYEFTSGKIGDLYKGALLDKSITSFTCEFPNTKKTYKWMVNALNGTLSSEINQRTISIDTTSLGIPVIVSPKNNDTAILSSPIKFEWSEVNTATSYQMEVRRDTISAVQDTTATVASGKALSVTYYSATISQKYYWRIRAMRNTTQGAYSRWLLFRRKS